jgi:hypothetical protein
MLAASDARGLGLQKKAEARKLREEIRARKGKAA